MQHNLLLFTLAVWTVFANIVIALNEDSEHPIAGTIEKEVGRNGKLLSPFTIISFPNLKCEASSKSGTCYTAEECVSKGGSSQGSCADGYGICCVFEINCGGSSSENNTYIKQEEVTSLTPPTCTYQICKCSSDICRLRFDFKAHVTAKPVEGAQRSAAATAANRGSIGSCATDLFSISGAPGSPSICGFNTGQHMIVDASDACNTASFFISPSETSTRRKWDIVVTQYSCGNTYDEQGGPPGCLQFFTAITGTISSFNFPTESSSITNEVTHLSNQLYSICIRKAQGYCYICYTPTNSDVGADDDQATFGLSLSSAATSKSVLNQGCTTDYIGIPGGTNLATAMADDNIGASAATAAITRICGRYFNTAGGAATSVSVCTRNAPFSIHFVTNSDEDTDVTNNMANISEESVFPAGIIGFSLKYVQGKCT